MTRRATSRKNLWPFSDKRTAPRNVTPARGGIAAHSKAEKRGADQPKVIATYRGYRISKTPDGEFFSSLDPQSWYSTRQQLKRAIDGYFKGRENPTDRAHRYRANRNIPAHEKRCAFCGKPKTVEVAHVNGFEEDTEPDNLTWTCRPCNVLVANRMRRAGAARLTHQYNPTKSGGAKSLGEWLTAVTSMRGENSSMNVSDAVAMIRATPHAKRSEFAREIWSKRKRGNPLALSTLASLPGVNSFGKKVSKFVKGKKSRNPRNPESGSIAMSESFHGRPVEEIIEVVEDVHVHASLAELGALTKLVVKASQGGTVDLTFDDDTLLCSNEEGSQLYIRGGDQSVDLEEFGIEGPLHDFEDLGQVKEIRYYTTKYHLGDEGGEATYFHHVAEEDKQHHIFKPRLIRLIYSTRDQLLSFAGGGYTVEPEGIRN